MYKTSIIDEIVDKQAQNGAFPSTVHLPSGKETDYNVFVTALVLDFLHDFMKDPIVSKAADKAIQFILSSQSRNHEGQFRFYPLGNHPKWMNEILYLDIDDSALCTRILLKYGIWSQEKVHRIVENLTQTYCLKKEPVGAAWFCSGVYPTWLDRSLLHNPIDLVVNLNMLHLIYVSTCDNVLFEPIVEMTNRAIEHLSEESAMDLISPYYMNTHELFYVLERCKKAGVPEIQSMLKRYHEKKYLISSDRIENAICCSYGNKVYWSSALLNRIRTFERTS